MGDPPYVLVVDDEPNFCRIMEAKLRRSGFDVRTARTRAEAIGGATERRYDAILLDYNLPEGSGLDLVQPIRSVSVGTPIILMTAYEEENLRPRALSLGVAEVLYKPFDLDRLVELVWLHIRYAATATLLASAVALGQAVVLQVETNGEHGVNGHVVEKRAGSFQVMPDAPLRPLIGSRIRVCVPGEDGLYSFRCKVIGHAPGQGILSLAKPAVIYRRQRRRYPRVPLDRPVALKLMASDGGRVPGAKPIQPPDASRTSWLAAQAQDISLGGMALVSLQPLAAGARVGLSWDMGASVSDAPIDARGIVVACLPASPQNHEARKRLSIRFTRLPAAARARIQSLVDALSPV